MLRSIPKVMTAFTVLATGISSTALSYDFPENKSNNLPSEVSELQKISRGVSAIAERTSGALVFISVAKTIKGMPFHTMDPFDYFFGAPRPQERMPREMPKQKGLGSGFIVDLDKGYIMTNNHVIEGADEINLKLANGKLYDGVVVGRDANTDVAVVKIKDPKFDRKDLQALGFADSDKVKVGDFVVALGAPFGLEASISFGVVSATGRGNLGIAKLGNFIQTDAAINPGNSGGPLVNTEGRVVAVNTAIFSSSGGYNGIGFGVPSNLVKVIGEKLINHGKISRGFLGVSLQDLDKDLADSLKVPRGENGAVVANVQAGSPAAKAGLRDGDAIVGLDGKTVRDSSDVSNRIGMLGPGRTADLTIYRDGKKQTLKVGLGEFPDEEALSQSDNAGGKQGDGPLGLSLSRVTNQTRQQYGIRSDAGVVVTGIAPESPLGRAGVRVGDVIVSVNNNKVTSVDDFKKLSQSNRRMLIRIERQGQFFFVSIRK